MDLIEAKKQLDKVIDVARVHLYKPVQIAEILKYHRENPYFGLDDLESYRTSSRKWRDTVSVRLVGRKCTSSARFQDNLFGDNAMPPHLMAVLGEENEKEDRAGMVEAYIYRAMEKRLNVLKSLQEYVAGASPETFDVVEFLQGFQTSPGLTTSIGKAYEITVYALFDALVRFLKATVTVKVPESRKEVLRDFEDFTKMVLGITVENSEVTIAASLYRVGVANAADAGIDMWTNFGPAVQVKHVSLTEDLAEDVVEQVTADRIVIVCFSGQETVIQRVLTQLGYSERIQGIITQNDLELWYSKCLTPKYRNDIGMSLLRDLHREFLAEFPSIGDGMREFLDEREYDKAEMKGVFITGN